MAWLRKKGKYWYGCFRDSRGRIHERSTKTPIKGLDRSESTLLKAKANVIATKYEMAARGELGNAAHFRRTLAELVDLSGGQQTETLGSWIEQYLPMAEKRYNSSSYNAAFNILDLLAEKIGGETLLESVSAESIQEVLDQRARVRATATVSKDRKLLSKFFADAVRVGHMDKNPVSATHIDKVTCTERKPFAPDEVKRMLKNADEEWKRVIAVASMTGLRLRDAIRIGSSFYDKALDAILIVETKTGKRLTIPVNDTLRDILKNEHIAPTLRELSNGALNKRFLKILEAAEIDREPVVGAGKNTTYRKSFHSLRHTFVSNLTNAGVDPEIRRKLAGHSSVEIHEVYTHHNIDRMRDAIGQLD